LKRTGFTFEISERLSFTLAEAEFLRARAREHYDGTCQSAAEPAVHYGCPFPEGLIHAMVIVASGPDAAGHGWRWFSFRELDLLCKVLEPAMKYQPEHAREATRLYFELKSFLAEMKAEDARLKAAGFGRATA